MHHIARPFSRLIGVGIGLTAVVLAGAGMPVGAQQTGAPQTWLRIDTVQVKPELWNEYREIERDEVIPAMRKAGVRSRAAWRTAEFGSTYELVLVRPVPDFGQYDSGDSFSALPPREAERLRERLRRCLISRDSAAILQRSDLSVGETGRPFAVVTTLTVAPGRGEDYEAFLRETLPEVRKAGVVFSVYQRVYGQPTAWLLVQNLDSLRELAQPPGGLFRAFGQEGADRRIRELGGILTSVERKVFRFDPELSFSFPGAADTGR
jgi:hypothetical protein